MQGTTVNTCITGVGTRSIASIASHASASHRQRALRNLRSSRRVPNGLAKARSVQPASASHDTSVVVQEVPEPATKTNAVNTPEVAAENSTHAFSWTARWWPVMPLENLDSKIPVHVDLLGESLVVWADSHGTWHCLEDRCPHRLAPLSEGRVEGDTLMCSYHGWQFSSSGACTRIPQLDHDPKAQASACSSKRSCAKSYPARTERGMLWVWPEAGKPAAATAAEEAIPVFPTGLLSWYVRDLPIRWDTAVENVLDPSHVPFLHHGLHGNRNQPGMWDSLSVGPIGPEGYTVESNNSFGAAVTFKAPFEMRYTAGDLMLMLTFGVPTKPGWSRVMTAVPAKPSPLYPLSFHLVRKLYDRFPAYYHIVDRNPVQDGDNYITHAAERQLAVGSGVDAITHACYMPARADRAPLAFRAWIDRFGGGVPTCSKRDAANMPDLLPRDKVFDRWEQHTKNCSHCKAALAFVERLQVAVAALGVLAAVAGTTVATLAAVGSTATAGPVAAWPVVGCAAVVLLCALVYPRLATIRQKFLFEDYVHALRN